MSSLRSHHPTTYLLHNILLRDRDDYIRYVTPLIKDHEPLVTEMHYRLNDYIAYLIETAEQNTDENPSFNRWLYITTKTYLKNIRQKN